MIQGQLFLKIGSPSGEPLDVSQARGALATFSSHASGYSIDAPASVFDGLGGVLVVLLGADSPVAQRPKDWRASVRLAVPSGRVQTRFAQIVLTPQRILVALFQL